MVMTSLVASALLLVPASADAKPPPPPGPPERIVLPVIHRDCDRTGDAEEVTVCGRSDRRFRIDSSTLATLRAIEQRNDPANRPRPRAITEGCSGIGPMDACGGNLPLSDMAIRAAVLAVKAIRGEELGPLLRKGPSDYDIHKQQLADAEARKK
ncbi:hypothetical protein GGQ97_000773 [Sphingomonas kaistensis]|uniref:Uncharacterized protein n=1 Tax=Sphingomonas kaistensis TaxID=298708 RepID=A0A7X5Y560_9SPHN|nr:hypothetical protein [Sphingomonas kaistensis]NJC04980.1 hypothetical protein [Sphingomonas kaistensis]